jgi:hypothetical protein
MFKFMINKLHWLNWNITFSFIGDNLSKLYLCNPFFISIRPNWSRIDVACSSMLSTSARPAWPLMRCPIPRSLHSRMSRMTCWSEKIHHFLVCPQDNRSIYRFNGRIKLLNLPPIENSFVLYKASKKVRKNTINLVLLAFCLKKTKYISVTFTIILYIYHENYPQRGLNFKKYAFHMKYNSSEYHIYICSWGCDTHGASQRNPPLKGGSANAKWAHVDRLARSASPKQIGIPTGALIRAWLKIHFQKS